MYMDVSLIIFLINNLRSDKRQAKFWVKRESFHFIHLICFMFVLTKGFGRVCDLKASNWTLEIQSSLESTNGHTKSGGRRDSIQSQRIDWNASIRLLQLISCGPTFDILAQQNIFAQCQRINTADIGKE